jgi:hypothetical protein
MRSRLFRGGCTLSSLDNINSVQSLFFPNRFDLAENRGRVRALVLTHTSQILKARA